MGGVTRHIYTGQMINYGECIISHCDFFFYRFYITLLDKTVIYLVPVMHKASSCYTYLMYSIYLLSESRGRSRKLYSCAPCIADATTESLCLYASMGCI